MLNDAHCHFFSSRLFATLARQRSASQPGNDTDDALSDALCKELQWDAPGPAAMLADRWVAELDANGVERSALIASIPGDEDSVVAAIASHRDRFVGFFMLDPSAADAVPRARRALGELGLRTICLFPAMHHIQLDDDRTRQVVRVAAETPGAAVFVHCGVLSVGVRKKLGLPSPYEIRFGNPLDLHALAIAHPSVPIIIPHFGAGLLREALMIADLCPNILFDTSSSNGWIKYMPELTLHAVFKQALAVVGPDRLLFGSDSSFFPRGWVKAVYEQQSATLDALGVDDGVKKKIFGGNFDRVFPVDQCRP